MAEYAIHGIPKICKGKRPDLHVEITEHFMAFLKYQSSNAWSFQTQDTTILRYGRPYCKVDMVMGSLRRKKTTRPTGLGFLRFKEPSDMLSEIEEKYAAYIVCGHALKLSGFATKPLRRTARSF